MIGLQFALGAVIVVLAAVKLAEYGDAIAYQTKLSGMLIGVILLASATSLPEILTMISSINQDHINLTAGDLFGSSMFNMLLLGLLDMVFYRNRILRRVALKHALTASLATMLTGMAVFFILTDVDVRLGWFGLDSLMMLAIYFGGIWLLRANASRSVDHQTADALPSGDQEALPLPRAAAGFLLSAAVLVLVVPSVVHSGAGIAKSTGLGDGFVGLVLIASVTSLPELVAMVAAARMRAYDMAVGNLFGSNMFNMFALALADILYLRGSFFGAIDPGLAIAGLLAMLLTMLGLIGNLAHIERRLWFIELDALLLITSYFVGIYLLYMRGVGG